MTDEALIDQLLRLSEDDKLSDDESDAVVLAVRILEKRERKKSEVIAQLRGALSSAGML